MSIKVKTQYLSSFNMPPYCVACGNSPGKKVSASKSDWTGKRTTTLNINFPLCQQCAEIEKRRPWFVTVAAAGAVLIPIGLCLVVSFTGEHSSFLNGVIVWFATALPLSLLSLLLRAISMSPEQRKVHRSVRIERFYTGGVFGKGWVSFRFENPTFANEFCRMNLGEKV